MPAATRRSCVSRPPKTTSCASRTCCGELGTQVDSLKRQGRQASRYKTLSAEIRRLEALVYAISYADAREQAALSERQAAEDLKAVADTTEEQTRAATAQAIAAHAIPALREDEARAAAALQRLTHARTELDNEERRSKERVTEIARQIADLERDVERETDQQADARAATERLREEAEDLALSAEGAEDLRADSEARLESVEESLAGAEGELSALQAQVSDQNARRAALERSVRDEMERAARFASERQRLEQDIASLAEADDAPPVEALREDMAVAEGRAEEAELAATESRDQLATAREAESRSRQPLADAERKAQRLETEARTLAKLFASATSDLWPPALDQITIEKGYETALGAALGDDLDASTNESAPAHWAGTGPGDGDPSLPGNVRIPRGSWRTPPRPCCGVSGRSESWSAARDCACAAN